MSAFDPKRTFLVAPHMSAFDPKRTLLECRNPLLRLARHVNLKAQKSRATFALVNRLCSLHRGKRGNDLFRADNRDGVVRHVDVERGVHHRSEEHTSELQSLMHI